MEITASRRALSRSRRVSTASVKEKDSLLRRLCRLVEHDQLPDPQQSVNVESDFDDIIAFRSQVEAERFVNGAPMDYSHRSRRKILKAPDVSEEEFKSLQQSIQQKSAQETLLEYINGPKKFRNIPDEVHERTARDLDDEDDWCDLIDGYESSSDDEVTVTSEATESHSETTDTDSESDSEDEDFTLIEEQDKSVDSTQHGRPPSTGDNVPFEIRSRTRSSLGSTPEKVSIEGSKGRDDESIRNRFPSIKNCIVILNRLDENDLPNRDDSDDDFNISSAFDPPSCSTSIGHASIDSEHFRMRSELNSTELDANVNNNVDNLSETDHLSTNFADQHTLLNVAHGESTIRRNLSLSPHGDKGRVDKPQPSPSSLQPLLTSPESGTETPIRKRLRELGILSKLTRGKRSPSTSVNSHFNNSVTTASNDTSGGSSIMMKRFARMDITSTPTKRSRHSDDSRQLKRTVQVFATPLRPVRTLEEVLSPTVDLAHLVKMYGAPRHSLVDSANPRWI